MKYLIVSGNPKKDGLCHALTEEVKRGAKDGGADVEVLELDTLERCHVCDDGWGSCLKEHTCAFGKDGFNAAQEQVRQTDALCFITPVYWAEMAEGLKSFFDRLRRCENFMRQNGALCGKQVLLIASAGGTGNGMLTCLEQMDRVCRHTNAVIFDYIAANRWNNDYKKVAVYAAAKAMAQGRKNGETV